MLTDINGYVLSTKVAEYPQGVVSEFSEADYADAERANRSPQFRDETYYHGLNNIFLGVEWQVMLSVIDGVICKISIRRVEADEQDAAAVRQQLTDMCAKAMGDFTEKREIFGTVILIWDAPEGNVVLQCDVVYTELILTSCSISMARPQRRSFWQWLFGTR